MGVAAVMMMMMMITLLMFRNYCETHKKVNTRNIYGMLLFCEEIANKV